MARRTVEGQEFLAELLFSEEGRQRIRDIWDDITSKRMKRVTSINCPRCKEMKKVDIEVEKYDMRELNAFLKFAADFGISKPAQKIEETKDVRVRHTLQALEGASIEELREIANLNS